MEKTLPELCGDITGNLKKKKPHKKRDLSDHEKNYISVRNINTVDSSSLSAPVFHHHRSKKTSEILNLNKVSASTREKETDVMSTFSQITESKTKTSENI